MPKRRIAIGGLSLPANAAWEFTESDGAIVGRRMNDPGVFRIIHANQEELPQPVTHEFCLAVLRVLLKIDEEPADRQMMESVCGPYGAATFVGQRLVTRAWYCRRLPGLIYGVYGCPTESARGEHYRFVLGQCAHMMAEVIYDRVAWGATGSEDPLTQILLDNFERMEHDEPHGLS